LGPKKAGLPQGSGPHEKWGREEEVPRALFKGKRLSRGVRRKKGPRQKITKLTS